MTQQPTISTREQVTIMVVTTTIEFACGFGAIALLVLGWYDVIDGSISARQVIALPVSFLFALWTGYHAMQLVVRPTRRGMILLLLRCLLTLAPIVALEF
ncbi:MAG: hypothetical protein ABW184_17010 [Sphingobium sp.]